MRRKWSRSSYFLPATCKQHAPWHHSLQYACFFIYSLFFRPSMAHIWLQRDAGSKAMADHLTLERRVAPCNAFANAIVRPRSITTDLRAIDVGAAHFLTIV